MEEGEEEEKEDEEEEKVWRTRCSIMKERPADPRAAPTMFVACFNSLFLFGNCTRNQGRRVR